jgi:hypothetical protein
LAPLDDDDDDDDDDPIPQVPDRQTTNTPQV